MMRAQFELHMKGSAALWFATEQEVLNNCQWREVKKNLSRCRPSLQSMAMDLSRLYQRADETVKQFGERFCRAQANFPDKREEVKLVEFMDKLQPKLQTIMATHVFRSLTEAIDNAINLEERAELKLRKEEEIERIVGERMLALQRKEPNKFSQRHTQLSSHGLTVLYDKWVSRIISRDNTSSSSNGSNSHNKSFKAQTEIGEIIRHIYSSKLRSNNNEVIRDQPNTTQEGHPTTTALNVESRDTTQLLAHRRPDGCS
jgi:hypothetical protein